MEINLLSAEDEDEQNTGEQPNAPHSYLQFFAVLIINRHGDLHVFGRGLAPLVKVPENQSQVDVVPHVTFRKQKHRGQT